MNVNDILIQNSVVALGLRDNLWFHLSAPCFFFFFFFRISGRGVFGCSAAAPVALLHSVLLCSSADLRCQLVEIWRHDEEAKWWVVQNGSKWAFYHVAYFLKIYHLNLQKVNSNRANDLDPQRPIRCGGRAVLHHVPGADFLVLRKRSATWEPKIFGSRTAEIPKVGWLGSKNSTF